MGSCSQVYPAPQNPCSPPWNGWCLRKNNEHVTITIIIGPNQCWRMKMSHDCVNELGFSLGPRTRTRPLHWLWIWAQWWFIVIVIAQANRIRLKCVCVRGPSLVVIDGRMCVLPIGGVSLRCGHPMPFVFECNEAGGWVLLHFTHLHARRPRILARIYLCTHHLAPVKMLQFMHSPSHALLSTRAPIRY